MVNNRITTLEDNFNGSASTRINYYEVDNKDTVMSDAVSGGGGGGGSSSSGSSNSSQSTSNSSSTTTSGSSSFTYDSTLKYNAYFVKYVEKIESFMEYGLYSELIFGALFNITEDVHTYVTSNVGSGKLVNKKLINTIDLETFTSNINAILSDETNSSSENGLKISFTYDGSNKYWILHFSFKSGSSNIDLYKFYIIFEPCSAFSNKSASLNSLTPIYKINSNVIYVEFSSFKNEHNISIKYATVRDYIWFRLTSYEELKNIKINDKTFSLTSSTENIFSDYINEALKVNLDTDSNIYVNKTGASPFDALYENTPTELGSKFYYSYSKTGEMYNYTFKAFLPILLNSDKEKLSDAEKISNNQINVKLYYSETVDETDGSISELDTIENSEESISSDNAIRVFSNTHTSVDYKYKANLYSTFEANKEYHIASYKINDNNLGVVGNITLFYGNQIIYSDEYSKNHSLNSSVTYRVLNEKNYIKVYLKTTKNFVIRKFINVFISDDVVLDTDIQSSYESSKISQETVTLHSIDINIPPVSVADENVYIDDSFNGKTKHYTNYTKLENEDGSYSYYGIRAYGKYSESGSISYFSNTLYGIGIEGITYNVPAKIVKLTPKKEQRNIYSFKTGPELILLNKVENNIEIQEGENGTYHIIGHELLNSSYALSYEYIIDKKIPTDKSTYYNIDFYTAYAVAGKNPLNASILYNVNNSTYSYSSFSVEYTYSYDVNTDTYLLITDTNNKLKPNETIYEYKYTKYSSNEELIPGNVYEEVEEYVKLQSKNVPFSVFKSSIMNKTTNENAVSIYYKYDGKTKNYIPYTYNDLRSLSNTPLNIYVKYVYYLKTPEHGKIQNDGKTLIVPGLDGKPIKYDFARYKLNVTYILDESNLSIDQMLISNDKYYQYKTGSSTYIPVTGLVKDGSVDYYGFKLIPYVDLKDKNLINLSAGGINKEKLLDKTFEYNGNYKFYVSHDYVQLFSTNKNNIKKDCLTKEEISVLSANRTEIFNFISHIDYVPIEENLTIYDVDLSGKTIYAYGDELNTIIDIDTIKDQIQNIDWSKSESNKDNILRNPKSKYLLKNFEIGEGSGHFIKNVVSFKGNYERTNYDEIVYENSNNIELSTKKIYIKKNGLAELNDAALRKIAENVDSDNNMILTKYKIDDILYVPVFKKLTPDDLNDDYNIIEVGSPSYKYKYFYISEDNVYAVENNNSSNKGLLYEINNLNDSPSSKLSIYKLTYKPSDVYQETKDLHLSINKNYFKKVDKVTWTGKLEGSSSYIKINPTPENVSDSKVSLNINDSLEILKSLAVDKDKLQTVSSIDFNNLTLKYDTLELYSYGVSYYLTYHNDLNNRLIDDKNQVSSYEMYIQNILEGKNSYTNEIYFKTSFLYPSYSFNNGINIDSNGSYYSDILVFDSFKGKISKRMYLNNHVINVTKYTYDDVREEYSQVSDTNELRNISKYDYFKYYIKKPNENIYKQLSESDESLLYYNENGYNIYTKTNIVNTYDYNNIGLNQLSHNESPVVITNGNNFYGIIFNSNIFKENEDKKEPISFETYNITFENGHKYLTDNKDSLFLDIYTMSPAINDFDYLDNQNMSAEDFKDYGDADTYSDVLNDIYKAANNELYYNNYNNENTKTVYYSYETYKPVDYLYEIVKLSEFTFRNYNSDASLIQAKEINTYNIETSKPFTIANSEEIVFDGSYTWVPPKYKTKILDDGKTKVIIEQEGYWHKNYQKKEKPLSVYSYNYFTKDEVSAINVSYNFIPYSYVITAEINHPRISYNYLISELSEEIKYSYIINGFEYDYQNDANNISYENGTYYGLVKLYDIDGKYNEVKTKLYKKNTVVNHSSIKEIVNQEEYVSYEYFAYKESTPLSNEKVPVLYKTELIPAKNKKIQFWNSNKNSYNIKTVLESYAYYAYYYTYETIPFKVASYIYTDDLRISNFSDLGYHIDKIGDAITAEMGKESGAVEGLTTDLSYIFNNIVKQDRIIANEEIKTFKEHSYDINENINKLNSYTNSSLSYFSSNLNTSINNFTTKEVDAINNLSTKVVNEIIEQHNIIKDSLNGVEETLNHKLNSVENTLHSDIIGQASKENIDTEYIRSTYTPIVEEKSGLISGYSYTSETGNQTLTIGGDSIGEILQSTLGNVSTYTVTENNEDGSYTVTTYKGFIGLANILANLSIANKIPNYNEFMVDLVPKMFASVDFEGDYNIVYDINGNVKSKEKRNPTDIAKKCILRADILWNELKKKNIVN